MHVGIVGGTGPAGRALGARLSGAGMDVGIGSRDASRGESCAKEIAEKWHDRTLSLSGGSNEDVAKAPIVVIATPWDGAAQTAAGLASQLDGKVVVSMANALVKVGREFHALVPARGSVAAQIQAAVPGARVVAAFQHLPAHELGDLDHPIEADVMVCSDHRDATDTVIELASSIPGLRCLDAGGLASACAVESMTAVLLTMNLRYRTRMALRVTGFKEVT